MLMPVSAAYADAMAAGQIGRARAMMRLVPYPFMIGALGEPAGRCVSILCKNIDVLESMRNGLREGLDADAHTAQRCVGRLWRLRPGKFRERVAAGTKKIGGPACAGRREARTS